MKIKVISVGQKMPDWVNLGVKEYVQRMPKDFALEMHEVPLAQRTKNTVVEQAKLKEAHAIRAAIPANSVVVALEVLGREWSTEQYAKKLAGWRDGGQDVCLLVGGPDGLDAELSRSADVKWSLSALTLPHPLVRVMLAEQTYRAWSFLQGHPYHRGG